ncbi:MAG: hypothetical protein WCB88_08715, partial [Azonexus sp.]
RGFDCKSFHLIFLPGKREVELPTLHHRLRQNVTATICRTLYAASRVKNLIFANSIGAGSAKMHYRDRPDFQKPCGEQENTD